MPKLRQSISGICKRMYEYGTNRKMLGGNEMLTRYILIDPILRALRWNLEDPDNVFVSEGIVHHKSGKKVHPDYALRVKGKIVAYIEAKCWGTMYGLIHKDKINEIKRTKEYRQLAKYCRECKSDADDMPLGILTDGGAWWVCDFRKRKFEDRVKGIDLGKHKPEEVVSFLLQLRPGRISDLFKE